MDAIVAKIVRCGGSYPVDLLTHEEEMEAYRACADYKLEWRGGGYGPAHFVVPSMMAQRRKTPMQKLKALLFGDDAPLMREKW